MINNQRKYRYNLRRGSRKDICPSCGRRTFTPYVDADEVPLSPVVGRCDRQDKCRYHYSPSDFRHDNPPIDSDRRMYGYRHTDAHMARRKRYMASQCPSFIPKELCETTLSHYDINSLVVWLRGLFRGRLSAAEVDAVAAAYGVGTCRMFGGSPVLWQIDGSGRVRTGKIMGYDPQSGRRRKSAGAQMAWVHTLGRVMESVEADRDRFRMQQCYFGSHRVAAADKLMMEKSVELNLMGIGRKLRPMLWLFESEKAALIVALLLEYCGCGAGIVPIACGGCGGFNPDTMRKRDRYDAVRLLQGREVVLFPDNGKYEEWRSRSVELRNFARKTYVATIMEPDIAEDCVGRSKAEEGILGETSSIAQGAGFDDLLIPLLAATADLAPTDPARRSADERLARLLLSF